MSNQKLELTWIGKNKDKEIEPRILIEDKEKSYGDKQSENMLIHGDNLLALKALEEKFTGKIKCIYIDPPYNTGSAFEHYDDNLEHSTWLGLMKKRIEILKKLLANDGLIFVQIDDNEQAYLTIMMDEIFGRSNRLNTICVKMSEATGVKMTHANKRLPKLKEYILIYKKSDVKIKQVKIPKEKWDSEYKIMLLGIDKNEIEVVKEIMQDSEPTEEKIKKADNLLTKAYSVNIEEYFKENNILDDEKEKFKYENAWRIMRDVATTGGAKEIADEKRKINKNKFFLIRTPKNKVYMIKSNYNQSSEQPRIKMLFADDYLMVNPCDLWLDITTTGLEAEGNVQFKNSKKPEKLIKRCIELITEPNDWVLDSFLGSGTTCAVAHKMGRKWIGIEMGEHCYTHCIPRINSIIDGNDTTGISKSVDFKLGGGYRFYELAPSLLIKDKFNNWVISEQYNAEMLVHTICKQEKFKYLKENEQYWKQGYSSENDYIHITTSYVSIEYLKNINDEMKDTESLLICCKAYQEECENYFDNINIKKIPQSILNNCEYGTENYNLNVVENVNENEELSEDDGDE